MFENVDHARNKKEFDFTVEEIHKLVKGIEEGSSRTAEIVRGLRNFSRMDENEIKNADIHEGVDSTLTLLHNKYKNRIEVVKDYDSAIGEIECYPGPLNQVFMNLLSNAIDAIDNEGKILIRTIKENDKVKIMIRDTGAGMPGETVNKIFDPFFTTKPVGEGTGLGLAITYGIIEKHHGKISVVSAKGEGTEFTIMLPIRQPH